MVILQAIILGIIEGLTEFLPISSTGHLIVAERAIGYHDAAQLFTVVIQVGALAAVAWFYRMDLLNRLSSLLAKRPRAINFWKNLAVAAVPACLVGLVLNDFMDSIAKPGVVGLTLVLGGFVLWAVEARSATVPQVPRPRRRVGEAAEGPSTGALDDITTLQALKVGLAQVVALVPGVSRSGATIVGGLLSGLDRVTATAFSFYLGVPMLVLASGYKLVADSEALPQVPGGGLALMVGTAAAFVTALAVVGWFLKYVSRHNFMIFAYYRIVFGAFILLLAAAKVL